MNRRARAEKIVEEVRRDRKRGASALAERALEAVALSKGVAGALIKARPSMPVIEAAVRLAKRKGVAAARRALRGGVAKIAQRSKKVLPAGARYAVFSASGTIEAVLKAVRAKRVKDLPSDVALVGADAVYPSGDFVNAKGTAKFVRRARRAGAAVFVVASILKRVRREVPLERGFELVPGHMVHAFLTEKGIGYPKQIVPRAVRQGWLDRHPAVYRPVWPPLLD